MEQLQFASCIEACKQCAIACNHCATACLQEPDVKLMTRCIALDIDCAAICELASGAMARGSENVNAICALCAELCEICGEECARHMPEHCQQSARACQRCADECQRVSQQAQKSAPSGAGMHTH